MKAREREKRLPCAQCGAKTLHLAVPHDAPRGEVYRAQAVIGAFAVAGVGLGALVQELVLRKLQSLPLWLDVSLIHLVLLGLFAFAVLLGRRFLGRKGFEIAEHGKYFDWQCELCGKIRPSKR